MKEVKYIPGDLAMFNDEVVVIRGVIDNTISFYYPNKGKVAYAEKDKIAIKPIPITEKILKANGWKPYQMFFSKELRYEKGEITLYVPNEGTDCWNFAFGVDYHHVQIYYVHELQHLLFGVKYDSNMKVKPPSGIK